MRIPPVYLVKAANSVPRWSHTKCGLSVTTSHLQANSTLHYDGNAISTPTKCRESHPRLVSSQRWTSRDHMPPSTESIPYHDESATSISTEPRDYPPTAVSYQRRTLHPNMAPSIESMPQYDEEAIITARRAENLKPHRSIMARRDSRATKCKEECPC